MKKPINEKTPLCSCGKYDCVWDDGIGWVRCDLCMMEVKHRGIENRERNIENLLLYRNIPKRYLKATLRDFDNNLRKSISAILKKNDSIAITGEVGTGKTHLICAIIRNEIVLHNADCLFIEYSRLVYMFRESINSKEYDEILDRARTTNHLFIDDIGTTKQTDYVYEKFYDLINYRYNEWLQTSFSMNKGTEEKLDNRICRRLFDDTKGIVL